MAGRREPILQEQVRYTVSLMAIAVALMTLGAALDLGPARDFLFHGALLIVVTTIGTALAFIRTWTLATAAEDTAASTCRGVFVGTNAVQGRAVPVREPLRTPFFDRPAVWCDWVLYESQPHDQRKVRRLAEAASIGPFWLEDDTGRVLVRPRGAKVDVDDQQRRPVPHSQADRPLHELWAQTFANVDLEEERYLPQLPMVGPPGRPRMFQERSIRPNEHIYVRGPARPRADGHGLEMVIEPGEGLLISTSSRAALVGEMAAAKRWFGVLALGSAFIAGGLHGSLWGRIDDVGDGVLFSIGSALAMVAAELLGFGVLLAVRTYNRQVRAKEQAARAWSLIDVTLRRRAELLPELVSTVSGAAAHERSLQALLTSLRADPVPTFTDQLPQDGDVVEAERVGNVQRQAWEQATAAAERYPGLHADESYLRLQDQLRDAEETVSSARWHYNDAVTVLRTRRRELPGRFVAPLVHVPSWDLFEEQARYGTRPDLPSPPPVEFVPSSGAGARATGGPSGTGWTPSAPAVVDPEELRRWAAEDRKHRT